MGGASGPRSSQRGRRCADGSRGGYLVASSQGDSTLHVVALDRGHEHLGSFGVAGVEETDAASADTDPINGFEHDGSTQWKFVQWEAVAARSDDRSRSTCGATILAARTERGTASARLRRVLGSSERSAHARGRPMIVVRRSHDLGLAKAKRLAERMAERLQAQYGGSYTWDGDELSFRRTGASGSVAVTKNDVEIRLELGFLLRPLGSRIEREIQAFFNDEFGKDGAGADRGRTDRPRAGKRSRRRRP